jgi:hypothetical protein
VSGAILTGILAVPVSSIRDNPPWALNCVVMVPVRRRGEKSRRAARVKTVWQIADDLAPPRLLNAFPKP